MAICRKVTLLLTGIFLFILLAISIILVGQGRNEYAQNIAVKACVWSIYTYLEIRCGWNVSHFIRILVMSVLISDSFIGLYLDLYTLSTVFDKIQHVVGSYAFSLFGYTVIDRWLKPNISRLFRFIFVVSLGLSIGALYEIGEFIGDSLAKPAVPSQPSLLDTDLDLAADLAGSLLAAAHITALPSLIRSPK